MNPQNKYTLLFVDHKEVVEDVYIQIYNSIPNTLDRYEMENKGYLEKLRDYVSFKVYDKYLPEVIDVLYKEVIRRRI